MTAYKKNTVFAAALGIAICAAAFVPCASPAAEGAPATPPYDPALAFNSIIDPHNQINDEGDILWEKCIICHKGVPDIKAEKSIGDVKLRYNDDMKELCLQCHVDRRHPGTEGASAMISAEEAPDHLVVASPTVKLNLRLMLKDVPTIFPFDPKTGKVTCVTCHNPHEKGVLIGMAGWGADSAQRLRAEGLDICQFCHRK